MFLIFYIKLIDSSGSEDCTDINIEDVDQEDHEYNSNTIKIVDEQRKEKRKFVDEYRIPTRKKKKEDSMV